MFWPGQVRCIACALGPEEMGAKLSPERSDSGAKKKIEGENIWLGYLRSCLHGNVPLGVENSYEDSSRCSKRLRCLVGDDAGSAPIVSPIKGPSHHQLNCLEVRCSPTKTLGLQTMCWTALLTLPYAHSCTGEHIWPWGRDHPSSI